MHTKRFESLAVLRGKVFL